MKAKALLALTVLLLLGSIGRASAVSEQFWVYGNISDVPTQQVYNNQTYLQFTMLVNSTSAPWIDPPANMTVAIPVGLLVGVSMPTSGALNATGAINIVGFPPETFIAQSIDWVPDWMTSLKQFIGYVGEIGKVLVTFIVQVAAYCGFTLPSWAASLALIAFVGFVFAKLFKKLPLILVIVAFFVCASLVSNLVTGFWLL